MSGFWDGSVPAWAYVVVVLLANAALLVGMWIGYGRGWEHCEEDQRWAREQAKARRVHPVYRVPGRPEDGPLELDPVAQRLGLIPPEVAHEAWLAHTEQAMDLANDDPTVSAWTARMASDMDRFLGQLLGQHPAVEDLP